jgi:iron complex outermembrane receptor protein
MPLSPIASLIVSKSSYLLNGDGGTITGTIFRGRQLRAQHDVLNDFDFESEPLWIFKTGKIRHTLLTGFEAQHRKGRLESIDR